MIRLIQWLLFGHVHKYEQVEDCEIKMIATGKVVSKIYIQRCSCGKMKKFEVLT